MKELDSFVKQFTEKKIDGVVKLKNGYYKVGEEQKRIMENIGLKAEHAGIFLGDKKDRFRPSIALLDLLAGMTDRKAVIDDRSEWLFLCGRDVFRKSLISSKDEKGIAIIENNRGDVLGLGKLQEKGQIAIKNVIDRGNFLRRER